MSQYIYILNHQMYKRYFDNGFYRLIPKKLILKFEKGIKSRILCKYFREQEKEKSVIGYGTGLFLTPQSNNKLKYIDRIIKCIEEIDIRDTEKILLDDIILLNKEDIEKIESNCNMKVITGRKVLLELTNYVIKKICHFCDRDIRDIEVLIISDDTFDTKKIALEIAKEIKYLTVEGENEIFNKKLYDEILMGTGLSIYVTHNSNKRIGNYNFIINFSENSKIDINKIKKRAVVFDFGIGRILSTKIRAKRKDIMTISDFIFKRSEKFLCEPIEFNFSNEVASFIYEAITDDIRIKDLKKIKISDRTYTIHQACDIFLKSNHSISNFCVK